MFVAWSICFFFHFLILYLLILLFPLMTSKDNFATFTSSSKSTIPLLAILPIIIITLLIGGFRTLILAYFMSLIRLTSARTLFLNSSSFFLSAYPYFFAYSVFTGYLFIDKLTKTGFGY